MCDACLQAFGVTDLPQVQSEAQQLWRARVRDSSPFLRVIKHHATSGHGASPWLQALAGSRSGAPSVDNASAQRMRALGGAYARLLKARNKQPERFVATNKHSWLCVPLARAGNAGRFAESRSQ